MLTKITSFQDFATFYDFVKDKPIPLKTAYRLAKLAKVADENFTFYREKFQSLLTQYGEVDENGNFVYTEDNSGIRLKPETQAEFAKKMTELDNLEVEIADIKFDLEEFDGLEIPPATLIPILPFINDAD